MSPSRELTWGHGGGRDNNDCLFCQWSDVCGKLTYVPTFTYTIGSGLRSIDVQNWYAPVDPRCNYIKYAFAESDFSAVNSRLFSFDSLNGRFTINTDAAVASDVKEWCFRSKGYNPCEFSRYAY